MRSIREPNGPCEEDTLAIFLGRYYDSIDRRLLEDVSREPSLVSTFTSESYSLSECVPAGLFSTLR